MVKEIHGNRGFSTIKERATHKRLSVVGCRQTPGQTGYHNGIILNHSREEDLTIVSQGRLISLRQTFHADK